MGEKLPYYCRVKKILAALKNGPKLARPVVKSALEKLSLCLSFLIMLMDWLLAPVLISASRDIDCQHVTVHCAMSLCTALCHYALCTMHYITINCCMYTTLSKTAWFCTFHSCTTVHHGHHYTALHFLHHSEVGLSLQCIILLQNITIFCTFHRCTTLSACTLLKCSAQCTAVGLSVNKATSVSFKGDDNSLPSPHSHCNFYRISFM